MGIRLGIFPALFFRDFFEGRPRLFLTAGIKLAGESFFVSCLVGLPLFLLGNCVVPVSTPLKLMNRYILAVYKFNSVAKI